MADIYRTFASAFPGSLEVTLASEFWYVGTGSPGPVGDMVYGLFVNGVQAGVVSKTASSCGRIFNYPGGGAVWTISTQVITRTWSGATLDMGHRNLQVAAVLIKK